MIETRAARLAAERRTPADAAALEAALERRDPSPRGARTRSSSTPTSHCTTAIVAAAGNPVLTALFEQFVPTLRETLTDLVRQLGRADENLGHRAHAALVAAVAEGNPDRAEGRGLRGDRLDHAAPDPVSPRPEIAESEIAGAEREPLGLRPLVACRI